MGKYGKWLAGGLGWALGGPIGGIIGFVAGTIFDDMSATKSAPATGPRRYTSPGDFNVSLLVLTGSVMKADGRILKSELDFVKRFLVQQFGQQQAEEQILFLREILKQDYSLRDVCFQIHRYMAKPARLQLLHFLFGISMADGQVHPAEIAVISEISNYFGISAADFESLKAMFIKDTESAYKILEISPEATNEEIKKAYRRMAVKYHPDKVSQMGEDIQRAAKEKFQKLNNAYETIKKERGMN